jgi:hypothetical protein
VKDLTELVARVTASFDRPTNNILDRKAKHMTASLTGRKRCLCGQYFVPLANGTMPRHTRPFEKDAVLNDCRPYKRARCEYSGKFPPAEQAARVRANVGRKAKGLRPLPVQVAGRPVRTRGGRRAAKRDFAGKARYRRNAAGGYSR